MDGFAEMSEGLLDLQRGESIPTNQMNWYFTQRYVEAVDATSHLPLLAADPGAVIRLTEAGYAFLWGGAGEEHSASPRPPL